MPAVHMDFQPLSGLASVPLTDIATPSPPAFKSHPNMLQSPFFRSATPSTPPPRRPLLKDIRTLSSHPIKHLHTPPPPPIIAPTLDLLPHTMLSPVLTHLPLDSAPILATTCRNLRSNIFLTVNRITFTPANMHRPKRQRFSDLFPNATHIMIDLSPPKSTSTSPPTEAANIHAFLQSLVSEERALLSHLLSVELVLPQTLHPHLTSDLAQLLHVCTHLRTIHLSICVRTLVHAACKAYQVVVANQRAGAALYHLDLLDHSSQLITGASLLSSSCARHHLQSMQLYVPEFFYGVTDSQAHKHLIYMLPQMQEALQALPHTLQSLSVCPLPSTFPLDNLVSLTSLDLKIGTRIDPDQHQAVMSMVSCLIRLKEIRVQAYSGTGTSSRANTVVPCSWSTLKSLTLLHLDSVAIEPESGIWALDQLEELELKACVFVNPTTTTQLQSLTSLTRLCVSHTCGPSLNSMYSVTAANSAQVHVGSLTRLQSLELETSAAVDVEHLPFSLTSLQITSFEVSMRSTCKIFPSWGNLHDLRRLALNVYGDGIRDNLDTVAQLTSLEELSLELLPSGTDVSCLDSLTRLTLLLLCGNGVTPFSWPHLEAAGKLQHLTLDMLSTLPDAVPSSVTNLRVQVCSQTAAVVSVPTHLSQCSALVQLYLSTNVLSGVETVAQLTTLKSLELDGLADETASALDALTALTQLSLYASAGAQLHADWPRIRAAGRLQRLMVRGLAQLPPSGLPSSLRARSIVDKDGRELGAVQSEIPNCWKSRFGAASGARGLSVSGGGSQGCWWLDADDNELGPTYDGPIVIEDRLSHTGQVGDVQARGNVEQWDIWDRIALWLPCGDRKPTKVKKPLPLPRTMLD